MSATDPVAAIMAALRVAEPALRLTDTRRRAWASATFEGARYTLGIVGIGDMPAFESRLADLEITLRGAFVADLQLITRDGDGCTVEALVIADA